LKIQNKNPKTLLCGDNAKISSRLIYLYVGGYRPLESSHSHLVFFYLYLLFLFVWNVAFALFIIDRNSLVKTL